MLKQKIKNSTVINRLIAVAIIGALLAGSAFGIARVRADQFDAQIQTLQQQNSASRATANSLSANASSYQDAINRLQQQIDSLQQDIVATQNKIDDLNNQITVAQANLDQQRKTLGTNIKQMYLEGDISTLEILASSKNLSEYVDKQQYRNAVSDKVKTSVDTINALKAQLEEQQRQQESLLKDKQSQQSQIVASQTQQNQLLSYTEGQISAYNQQISSNNSQIASLRAQQAAANRKIGGGGQVVPGDPGHGGYPSNWNNAVQDSMLDNWGMLNRECVSYTAWKVYQAYGYMPYWGGEGNANQWPGDAQAAGIPTGSIPKPGSVAISMSGAYGHAMWVEAVNGSTIYVSQYNYDLQGHYSEMSINGSGLIYIYFGG